MIVLELPGAVDQAMWDMAARRAGVPLWKHLGGRSGKVRVYASGIGPDKVVDVMLAKRDAGYRAFKLKVGFAPERDLANMRAAREALGDEAVIMCDANQAWQPSEAAGRIAALAPYQPYWIEEPMAADLPHADWSALAKASPVPLAAGENLRGDAAFSEALQAGYLGFVQPDVGKWGGIGGGLSVARQAHALGVAYCPHWLAGGVGLAASMHVLAGTGFDGGWAEVDANPNPLRELVFPFAIADGCTVLPDRPGLGVEPELDQLAEFVVRC
jgi:L-alanine-DL-glutamate epimerase-like enolase superfamily enzyme